MCFYIRNNKESATLWEATEDIVCYKKLSWNLVSPYENYQYIFNKLNKSYLRKIYDIKLNKSYYKNFILIFIYKGFHTFSTLNSAKDYDIWCYSYIYKCIIPKGSLFYYDNVNKQYVSNRVIVIKQVKTKTNI